VTWTSRVRTCESYGLRSKPHNSKSTSKKGKWNRREVRTGLHRGSDDGNNRAVDFGSRPVRSALWSVLWRCRPRLYHQARTPRVLVSVPMQQVLTGSRLAWSRHDDGPSNGSWKGGLKRSSKKFSAVSANCSRKRGWASQELRGGRRCWGSPFRSLFTKASLTSDGREVLGTSTDDYFIDKSCSVPDSVISVLLSVSIEMCFHCARWRNADPISPALSWSK